MMSDLEEELKPDIEAAKIVTDDELINIEIKELNKRIKEKGVSKELAIRLKQRRRTLKNRNYATSCREKKDAEIINLEGVKANELDDIRDLEQGNQAMRKDVEKIIKNYQRIVEFARENNMDLIPEFQCVPDELRIIDR
eukprot:TRINITY_DN3549_c0_g1_i3.p1 TRINITY_DN3549_c0_g1~~TRINITY_DN3549_c0_g1_i3.p1  ORF type:complete len:139 (+),score=26.83 TRINITY_DN3549_c0_g1_i3:56-472(+)